MRETCEAARAHRREAREAAAAAALARWAPQPVPGDLGPVTGSVKWSARSARIDPTAGGYLVQHKHYYPVAGAQAPVRRAPYSGGADTVVTVTTADGTALTWTHQGTSAQVMTDCFVAQVNAAARNLPAGGTS